MRCVPGQRGFNIVAIWLCFLIVAVNVQVQAGGYRTGRYSCCTGCTACSCASRGGSYGGAAPGTTCNACASSPGQAFTLQGGTCGKPAAAAGSGVFKLLDVQKVCSQESLAQTHHHLDLDVHRMPGRSASCIPQSPPIVLRLLHCSEQFTLLA
jgi:hypothetical protein